MKRKLLWYPLHAINEADSAGLSIAESLEFSGDFGKAVEIITRHAHDMGREPEWGDDGASIHLRYYRYPHLLGVHAYNPDKRGPRGHWTSYRGDGEPDWVTMGAA